MYKKNLKKDLKYFLANFGENTDIAFKYWIIGFILMALSNYIIILFSPVKTATNENSVRSIINATPIIALIFSCLVAPFIEEIIFRKSFKDAIETKWLFILVSGIVFGALHVVGNIESLYGLLFLAPYSFLGLAFAMTYYKTNNIFSSIFIHFFHNTLVILLAIFGVGVII
jgi:membrane protease YdiL (CAAX protease family)